MYFVSLIAINIRAHDTHTRSSSRSIWNAALIIKTRLTRVRFVVLREEEEKNRPSKFVHGNDNKEVENNFPRRKYTNRNRCANLYLFNAFKSITILDSSFSVRKITWKTSRYYRSIITRATFYNRKITH